jgi:outer membrane protein TolC
MLKKLNLSIIFLFILSDLSSFSLSDLITSALQNNSDISSAQSNYESAILSSKTLDGTFAPGISFSSSTNLSKDYDWDTSPDYFSTYVTYSQPLPAGTTISATGTYSFTSTTTFSATTASTTDAGNLIAQRYISQNPNISFTLSQSLLPFWAQGTIKDPTILGAKQQAEYYRLQLLATKKSVLQNLLQNYAYAQIYQKQIQLYQNSITLIEKQIAALRELKTSGSTNQAKITELESTKWSYQEDLMSVQASFYSYLQNLKNICACEIAESDLFDDDFPLFDDFFSDTYDISANPKTSDPAAPATSTGNFIPADPMEKIYQLKLQMLKTNRILEKQKSAPTLSLSLQPAWSFEKTKADDWKSAWKNGETPSWSASVGINFSPFLNAAVSKNQEQYEISYAQAEKSYENYLLQKHYVQEQYQTLVLNYSQQLENVANLYEEGRRELEDYKTQYEAGAISRLDFDSVKIRVENCDLSKNCVEIYKWLYTLLGEMN